MTIIGCASARSWKPSGLSWPLTTLRSSRASAAWSRALCSSRPACCTRVASGSRRRQPCHPPVVRARDGARVGLVGSTVVRPWCGRDVPSPTALNVGTGTRTGSSACSWVRSESTTAQKPLDRARVVREGARRRPGRRAAVSPYRAATSCCVTLARSRMAWVRLSSSWRMSRSSSTTSASSLAVLPASVASRS